MTPPLTTRGQLASLPMSEYTLVEPGKKWLMRVSTNNQAMEVTRISVSSLWDFEVEEIVCGGESWGARPREATESAEEADERERRRDLYRQSRHLGYLSELKTKTFTPPGPGRAIVPRGFDQLVVVASNRATVRAEPAPSPEGAQICAAAFGFVVDLPGSFRGGDETTRSLPTWGPSERQIEEYLERVRRPRAVLPLNADRR
jgi:hypothetical protein